MIRIFTFFILLHIICFSDLLAGTYSGGNGTVGNPYQISTTEDLIELSKTPADWSSHFVLTQDVGFNVDETQVDWDGDGSADWDVQDQLGFRQIGSSNSRFTGTFDGQGFEIENLFINRTSQNIGLFGYISGASALIENLGVTNVAVTGYNNVGGCVGYNYYGTISNCFSSGTVTGNYYIGGLVGFNDYGTISNCYSIGTVNSYSSINYGVGGLVGVLSGGTISECNSTGSVIGFQYVGGLVGMISIYGGNVNNSFAMANVNGSNIVGGLAGGTSWASTITNCYSIGDVIGEVDVGGLVGENYSMIESCFSLIKVIGNRAGGLVGRNSHTISNCYSTGSVNGNGSYFGGLIGSNSGTIINSYSNCDVSASLTNGSYFGGLIGSNTGTVSNCYSTGSVSGSFGVGGFIGRNRSISQIKNCYSTGDVIGTTYVGGFVGMNSDGAEVINCYSSGDVIGTTYVGGFVGMNQYEAAISNSYSIGSVSGTSFVGGLVGRSQYDASTSNSFWDTETSGRSTSAGGTGKTTAEMKDVATFTDENTLGLTSAWDFVGNPNDDEANDDIWKIHPINNDGYPYFHWQFPCEDDVFISELYDGNTPGWQATHHDNLDDALAIACDGATVNISDYTHTGDVDMTGYTFIIGDGDFDLDGTLSGGLIQTPSTGRLILPAVQNVQRNYPLGNGSNNFTLKIIPMNEPTNPILVRLVEKSVPGAVKAPMPFWEIEGDDDLDATIVFRIDKSAIAPKTLNKNSILRFFDGDKYVPVTEEQVTINDMGSYYEVIIINVNKF